MTTERVTIPLSIIRRHRVDTGRLNVGGNGLGDALERGETLGTSLVVEAVLGALQSALKDFSGEYDVEGTDLGSVVNLYIDRD